MTNAGDLAKCNLAAPSAHYESAVVPGTRDADRAIVESSDRVDELFAVKEEWSSARRGRVALFTAAALSSVSWWLRARAVGWLPAHAVDFGVALWATLLAVAIACRVHEWRLRRRLDRLVAQLQLPAEGPG
jgi:hypothetical protein